MSVHNEWVSQYHKILKVLFLNLCSSRDVWSRARNECGPCWQPRTSEVRLRASGLVDGGTGPRCGKCTFSSQLRRWPVLQLHKSFHLLSCVFELRGTEQRRHWGAQIPTQVWVVWTCTFADYLGASLLELCGVLLSSLPPFVPMTVGTGGGLYS